MKVKQKLKCEPEERTSGVMSPETLEIKKEREDLTPEDEERRRRRRERNKVAATKCRNKKKEKTHILVAESEIVEVQNASLKAEVARLDAEKRRLTSILALHQPHCAKRRRLCSEEASGTDDCYMGQPFRRPPAPCSVPATPAERLYGGQEQGYAGGFSTNIQSEGGEEEEEEDDDTTTQIEVFKTEPKDSIYARSGGGGMYDMYSLVQQPQAISDYSGSNRNLSYPGGYYDHMCLAL